MLFMWNERNHSICYTITTYEVHTFKNKNKIIKKRQICLSFSLLYLFIHSYKFVLTETETHAYNIAHDENVMNSKVYIRVRSKAATSVLQQKLFLKILQYSQENTYPGLPF